MNIKKFKQINENNNLNGIKLKKINSDYNNTMYDITEFMRMEKNINKTDYVNDWWYEDDGVYFYVNVVDENENGVIDYYHFGENELNKLLNFLNNKEEYINSKKYNLL